MGQPGSPSHSIPTWPLSSSPLPSVRRGFSHFPPPFPGSWGTWTSGFGFPSCERRRLFWLCSAWFWVGALSPTATPTLPHHVLWLCPLSQPRSLQPVAQIQASVAHKRHLLQPRSQTLVTGGQVSGTGRETDSASEGAEQRKEGEEETRKVWVSVATARPGQGSRGPAVALSTESARLGEGCRLTPRGCGSSVVWGWDEPGILVPTGQLGTGCRLHLPAQVWETQQQNGARAVELLGQRAEYTGPGPPAWPLWDGSPEGTPGFCLRPVSPHCVTSAITCSL